MRDEQRPRPNRRATDLGPSDSPVQRQRRIVRTIAADPVLVAWLAAHNATILERAATRLALQGAKKAAAEVRKLADEQRTGQVSAF